MKTVFLEKEDINDFEYLFLEKRLSRSFNVLIDNKKKELFFDSFFNIVVGRDSISENDVECFFIKETNFEEGFLILEHYETYLNKSGYIIVKLSDEKKFSFHRLVCSTFGDCFGVSLKKEINLTPDHLNKNKFDNRPENLELVPSSVNAERSGYSKFLENIIEAARKQDAEYLKNIYENLKLDKIIPRNQRKDWHDEGSRFEFKE